MIQTVPNLVGSVTLVGWIGIYVMWCNSMLRDIMREFKFRAWDRNVETMIHSDCTEDDYFWQIGENGVYVQWYDPVIVKLTPDGAIESSGWVDADCIIMQYTGLVDKNRKEIYEDDIYRIKGFRVIMQDKYPIGPVPVEIPFDYVAVVKMDNPFAPVFNIGDSSPDIEVLGNIYQNPDLLEQTHG